VIKRPAIADGRDQKKESEAEGRDAFLGLFLSGLALKESDGAATGFHEFSSGIQGI